MYSQLTIIQCVPVQYVVPPRYQLAYTLLVIRGIVSVNMGGILVYTGFFLNWIGES